MTRRSTGVSSTSVALEVSPRLAKLMVASPLPFQIQRLDAKVMPETTDDPAAALRALLHACALGGTKRVGVLFGRDAFSLQRLELPSMDAKEIGSMLELQLGKLTPYPRADILAAWALIGSFREGYTSVLLAIARKTLVDEVLRVLKGKGLSPLWMGVSTEGLAAWRTKQRSTHPATTPGQLTAIIDVDATSTDCALLDDERLVFAHSVPIGVEQLQASAPTQQRWLGELGRLPRILLHEVVKGQIGRGVVTGLPDALRPLAEQLRAQWAVEVEVVDALSVFATRPEGLGAQRLPVSFAALAGMLASGQPPHIDLIPHELRVSQALQLRAKQLARCSMSLVAIIILVAVLHVERIMMLRQYLATLQQRLSTVEQAAQQVTHEQHVMEEARHWLDPSRSALELLRAVASSVEAGMTVSQVSFAEGGSLKVRGMAEAVQLPYTFVDRLRQQPTALTAAGCYVANAKATGNRGVEFEVVCGKSGA